MSANPKKKAVYIEPETDAKLSALGGKNRAENIRRALAVVDAAEDMAFWLGHCAMESVDEDLERNIWDSLARYREAKQ